MTESGPSPQFHHGPPFAQRRRADTNTCGTNPREPRRHQANRVDRLSGRRSSGWSGRIVIGETVGLYRPRISWPEYPNYVGHPPPRKTNVTSLPSAHVYSASAFRLEVK